MNSFYVTTPIYYANSLPHLGHLYTMIVADTVHRYKEQRGIETYFLTGTDEHGINIERAAERAGRTPQEQADYVVDYYKRMTAQFALDTAHGGYDIFMRTTEPFHAEGVSKFWREVARSKTPKGREAISRVTTKAGFAHRALRIKQKTNIPSRITRRCAPMFDS
jgi:methionyl-tRNA synthetase